jgi:hypothetical protein
VLIVHIDQPQNITLQRDFAVKLFCFLRFSTPTHDIRYKLGMGIGIGIGIEVKLLGKLLRARYKNKVRMFYSNPNPYPDTNPNSNPNPRAKLWKLLLPPGAPLCGDQDKVNFTELGLGLGLAYTS